MIVNKSLAKEIVALSELSDRPSLVALSYALRHPETWPKDFVWNYSKCTSCAVGLALRLWPDALQLPDGQRAQETWIAREMAMGHRDAVHTFFGLARGYWAVKKRRLWFSTREWTVAWSAVTADHVADAIDAYLKKSERLPERVLTVE